MIKKVSAMDSALRPISNTQRLISKYNDGSIDISIMITSNDEIIPTI